MKCETQTTDPKDVAALGILRPVPVLLQNTPASAKGAACEENPRRHQGSAEFRRWRRRQYVQHMSGAHREKGTGTVPYLFIYMLTYLRGVHSADQ